MNRELEHAHYLHEKATLTALVRPPVREPRALVFDGRDHLLVGDARGRLVSVHPALGTRVLLDFGGEATGIGVDGERVVLVVDDGRWIEVDRDGQVVAAGEHPFAGRVDVRFHGSQVLLTGQVGPERQTLFFEEGATAFRIRLPERAAPFIDGAGHICLVRATPRGLECIRVMPGSRFLGREQTDHALHVKGPWVLGASARGLKLWHLGTDRSRLLPLPDLASADVTPDGHHVAMGTRSGTVIFVDLRGPGRTAHATEITASSELVHDVAFSDRSRWLASAGDDLIVWTWEG